MNIAIVTGASSGIGREFVRQLHGYIQPDEIWAIARRKVALEARDVAAQGLKDLYKTRKVMSIPGLGVKLQVLSVKLLPHKLVMKTWMNQQKKPLNNQGLTK